MKATVHSGWGAIDYDGKTYNVEDGTLEADAEVVKALHERYGDKVKPVDDASESDNSQETFYCTGKDGECSRKVDEAGGRCWQHPK